MICEAVTRNREARCPKQAYTRVDGILVCAHHVRFGAVPFFNVNQIDPLIAERARAVEEGDTWKPNRL